MFSTEEKNDLGVFQSIVGPWYESLKNPREAQKKVLSNLLREYQSTDYGKNHRASEIKGIEAFRTNFPVVDYRGLQPSLDEVKKGNYSAFLPEPLACWS